ncbi:MAG: hypothetical protein HYX32_05720 [Actinobacteria bacterium]|nr:hypothetical protein [Actinomycetota bacterium]
MSSGVVRWFRERMLDDRGAIGNIEVIPFGLLIFVAGTLLITNAWAVVDTRMAVSSASREAIRAYVESSNPASAGANARRAAETAIAGHGRDPLRLRVDIQADGFSRCDPVTIRAGYTVPTLHLPWVGGYGDAFDVSSSQTELIDPYRSGLAGDAQC